MFDLTAVCAVHNKEVSHSDSFKFDKGSKSTKQVSFNLLNDTDCSKTPFYISVIQQGPVVKYYRDRSFEENFMLPKYIIALFNDDGQQVKLFNDTLKNGFLSTLQCDA